MQRTLMSICLTENRCVVFMINCSKTENGILLSFVFVWGGGSWDSVFSKFAQMSNLCISD